MDLTSRIAALPDIVAVDVCESLAAELLSRPGMSLDEAIAALPREFTADPDLAALRAGLDDSYHTKLPPDLSVRLAREILVAAAADPALAPALTLVLESHRDTKQFALEVLALGAAVSMVILCATTSYENGKFSKKVFTAEQAKELAGWFAALKPWAH